MCERAADCALPATTVALAPAWWAAEETFDLTVVTVLSRVSLRRRAPPCGSRKYAAAAPVAAPARKVKALLIESPRAGVVCCPSTTAPGGRANAVPAGDAEAGPGRPAGASAPPSAGM